MENEQDLQPIIDIVGELVTTAGPEWTFAALEALLQEVGQGGGEMRPEVMAQAPMARQAPPAPRNALSGQ